MSLVHSVEEVEQLQSFYQTVGYLSGCLFHLQGYLCCYEFFL